MFSELCMGSELFENPENMHNSTKGLKEATQWIAVQWNLQKCALTFYDKAKLYFFLKKVQ